MPSELKELGLDQEIIQDMKGRKRVPLQEVVDRFVEVMPEVEVKKLVPSKGKPFLTIKLILLKDG